jgi:hypothetical protein
MAKKAAAKKAAKSVTKSIKNAGPKAEQKSVDEVKVSAADIKKLTAQKEEIVLTIKGLEEQLKAQRGELRKVERQLDPKGPSKMDRATEILKGMPNEKRSVVIATFESDLGMSKAAANTYYQIIRTRLGIKSAPKVKGEKKTDKKDKGKKGSKKPASNPPAPQEGSKTDGAAAA